MVLFNRDAKLGHSGLSLVALLIATTAGGALPSLPVVAAPGASVAPDDNLFAGQLLDANQLVTLVLQRSPDLQAAMEAAKEAATRIEIAGSLEDPMVGYTIAPATISSSLGTRQGFELSQGLPWPGTLRARKAKAKAEAVAAREDTANRRLDLISAAKAAFAEWAFVHAALNINERHRLELETLANAARRGYAAGAVSQGDATQSEIELLRTENEHLLLDSQRRGVAARINAMFDRTASAPLPQPSAFGPVPAMLPLDRLTELMLSHHPELRRAHAMLDASSSGVKLARKGFLPNLSVRAGYDEMWDDARMRPNVGISISVPLQWSRHEAELSGARFALRQAELNVESRTAQLEATLTETYASADQTAQSVKLYRDHILPLAETAAGAALSSYRRGAGSFKAAIDAERAKLNEQLNFERARADQFRALAELEKAAGGSLTAENRNGESEP